MKVRLIGVPPGTGGEKPQPAPHHIEKVADFEGRDRPYIGERLRLSKKTSGTHEVSSVVHCVDGTLEVYFKITQPVLDELIDSEDGWVLVDGAMANFTSLKN